MGIQFHGNWSFSSLMIHETCALRFKFAKVDRVPEPPRDPDNPMERGNRVHNRLEKYVKGETDEMDKEAKRIDVFVPLLAHLRNLYAAGMASAEQDWLFNIDWEICARDKVWLWAKLDASVYDEANEHVIAIDYKTGKSLYKAVEHVQQLQLYVAIAALRFPKAERFTAELWYLDEGHIKQFSVTREEALKFIGRFDSRAQKIYNDRFFRPNPNAITCAYCPYGPKRGNGHCPVGV